MFGISQQISFGEAVSAEKYAASSKQSGQAGGPGIDHFFEKLLRIKDMMTTRTGAAMALERHQGMLLYLRQLDAELEEATGSGTIEGGIEGCNGSSFSSPAAASSVFSRMLDEVEGK